jgi:predicted MPP superfamily phosphohydrolase
MGSIINILHLSDLHFTHGSEAYNQRVVLSALKEDLRQTSEDTLKPDLVIISGDLVYAADEKDVYLYLVEFLEELAAITRCSLQRFIVCPGNHDVHRDVATKDKILLNGFATSLGNRDALNDAYHNGAIRNYTARSFAAYNEFVQFLGTATTTSKDGITQTYQFDDIPVDILTTNTAWMSRAGVNEQSDLRKLLLPEAAILQFPDRVESDKKRQRILVTHHPLDWLAEFSETDVYEPISKKFDLHLFGHMHDPRPLASFSSTGNHLRYQSGALYTGRSRYNGYAIIQCAPEEKHSAITLRSYFDARRVFDRGIDRHENGIFYPSDIDKKYWEHRPQTNWQTLRTWMRETLHPAAQEIWNAGISDRPVSEIFVAPPMYMREVTKDDDGAASHDEKPMVLKDLVTINANYVVHGQKESSKTTLLKQLALRIIEQAMHSPTSATEVTFVPRVPLFLDFSEINPGSNRIEKALASGLPSALCSSLKFKDILTEGLAVILIDDVIFGDIKRCDALKRFIAEHPKNRYIFSTVDNIPNGFDGIGDDVIIDVAAPISFQHVFLKPFNRKDVRSLVAKWDREGRFDQEEVLNRITKAFAGMNIPVTAVNGTILLLIYEGQSAESGKRNEAPTNRSALIERFVEYLLAKSSLEDTRRRSFDFTNKVSVLAHLAGRMARNNEYVMEWNQIVKIVSNYLDAVGLVQDPNALISYFVTSKILDHRPDERVSFRYRAFLEYFIAREMQIDAAFKEWVVADERCLSYINEIQYYAGMGRNDHELLKAIAERFAVLNIAIGKELEWVPDLTRLETFQIPGEDSSNDLADEFERQMASPPLSAEERDELLDADLPHDAEVRQEVFRPIASDLGAKWVMTLLLYSGVLKNLELIPDHDKRTNLATVLEGWGRFTAQSLWVVPNLAKHRRLKINGITYQVDMPRHFTEAQVARQIYIDLPNSIEKTMSLILGTEKLERQLTEPKLNETTEPLIVSYFRYCLIADLHLGSWYKAYDDAFMRIKKSTYLLQVLLRKVSETYFLGGYEKSVEVELKRVVGHVAGACLPQSHKRPVSKSKVMQQIERKSLVNRLRLVAQETKTKTTDNE